MRILAASAVAVFGLLALAPGGLGEGQSLPAPITIQSGYGRGAVSYQIASDETVRRITPAPSAFPRDATWYPASSIWFSIRRRHLVIGLPGRVLWRSHGEFSRQLQVGAIQVGAQTVAFTYGEHLYMAPLGGSEQLIGRSEVPLGFTTGGLYTYQWGRRLLLRSSSGAIVKTIASWPFGSDYFTPAGGRLYFVARGFLQRARGASVNRVVSLKRLGLPRGGVALQSVGRLLELEDNTRLVIVRQDGSLFAQAPARAWGGGVPSSPGVLSPRGNAVAFAASTPPAFQTVYLLRDGAHSPTAVYRRRAALGCEQGSEVQWHGSWLLYSDSQGHIAAFDTADTDRVIDVTALVKRVAHVRTRFTAFWRAQPPEF